MAEKASELKIQLTLMDKAIAINSFAFNADRGTTQGFPSSTVSIGDLSFTFLWHKDFYDCWLSMMKEDDFIKGKVEFYAPTDKTGNATRTFEFGGGKIIFYTENWTDDGALYITITITAFQIKYGEAETHTRHWPNFEGPNLL